MVGREMGIGGGPSQFKVGLRVAQINGTTDGSGSAANGSTVVNYAYSQTNKWTGYGPRVALEGNTPLSAGPWSIDYMIGVAGLFGSASATQTASVTGACVSGCPTAATSGSNNFVFNADAMVGLAYAVTPNSKLALNYRADYYSNAMRTLNSAGVGSNTNRTYTGPNLRWTTKF